MIERMIFGKNDSICIAAQNVASLNLNIHSEGFSEISVVIDSFAK